MKCITKSNFISSSLVASKSTVVPIKIKLSIPRLELLGNLILSRLILTVLNTFQGEILISYLYAWTDSQVSLAWIKALHKEFQTFVQNRVVEIRKNILPENWSYCSTKVNSSDLITRLDKNIDLSKNSLWWRGPCFLFDKSQSCTKSNHCEKKETLPDSFTREFEREMKNKVISSKVEHLPINTIDNIIDIKGYSDVTKLFRFTALVIRFVKNLFQKVKGDNLNLNSYIDPKEICEAKVHWVKTNQLRLLKSENYEHLSKNLYLIFDKENIIRCYSRLENETENKHEITKSRFDQTTSA